MIYGYLLIVGLLMIILQTTLLVGGGPACLYDLMAPFVVFLGVYHRCRVAVPVLILGGLAMDGLSGGVFGVHLSVYLWMYAGVRSAIQFLHVGNVILLPMLVLLGVAFESLAVAFSAVVLASAAWPVEAIFSVVPGQIIWGLLTGPLLMILFIRGQRVVDQLRRSIAADTEPTRTA
jgi:hypothetical protein